MSDVFNLDNAGSGFSLDEEDDLDALMAEAEAGIEVDEEEEDTSTYFDRPTPPDRVFAAGPASEPHEEPQGTEEETTPQTDEDWSALSESISDSQEADSSEDLGAASDHADPDSSGDDGVEEVTAVEGEEEVVEDTEVTSHRPDVVDSALVARILSISSKYRELGEHEKAVVSQFINNGEVITAEEDLVMAVLNVDPALTQVMRALHEGRELESVDRAFYVIDLDESTLKSVGSLMTVFGNDEIPSDLPHSKYAREVVAGIDKLDDASMELVNATEAVLSAGEVISG